jgi:hypothetical protein
VRQAEARAEAALSAVLQAMLGGRAAPGVDSLRSDLAAEIERALEGFATAAIASCWMAGR